MVDAPLYGSILRILEWTIAAQDRIGLTRRREGNRLPNSAPLDNYLTADGRYVCVVAGSDANFSRLCAAMERPDLASTTPGGRRWPSGRRDPTRSTALWPTWAAALSADEVEARCIEHGVPVATIYDAADILADPHMAARGDLVTVDDPIAGPLRQQAPYPAARRPAAGGRRRRHPRSASTIERCGATWSASAPSELAAAEGGRHHLSRGSGRPGLALSFSGAMTASR